MGSKKKKDLIDSFVFRKAKANTDKITKQKNTRGDEVGKIDEEEYGESKSIVTIIPDVKPDITPDIRPVFRPDKKPNNRQNVGPSSDVKSDPDPTTDSTPDVKPYIKSYKTRKKTDPVWCITDRQAIILGYYIQQEDRIARRKFMIQETGIKENSIKTINKALVRYQFITKPKRHQNYGSTYSIYDQICNRFMDERWPEILKKYGDPPKINNDPTSNPTVDLTSHTSNVKSDPLYNSNCLNKKTITNEIEHILTTDPELDFWRRKGLTVRQIEGWIKETGASIHTVLQSLRHCAFDMEHNDAEKKIKPESSPAAYCLGGIRKGLYTPPNNYKSYRERQAEIEIQLAEQAEKEAQTLKEAIQRRYKVEQDKKFYSMLGDPECHLYKQCFDRLGAFGKRQRPINPGDPIKPSFESAMRKVFDELAEEEEGVSEK